MVCEIESQYTGTICSLFAPMLSVLLSQVHSDCLFLTLSKENILTLYQSENFRVPV